MKLTASELATVLAALRYWQRRVVIPADKSSNSTKAIISVVPELFADCEPLNPNQIEALCQRLNIDGH